MLTDKSIPYPRPDYTDKDLLTKELINGTFAKAIMEEIRNFKPVMDRYNVTEDNLVDMSMLKGNISPQSYDISITDPGMNGLREEAFLPAKQKVAQPDPEVVYDPRKHYTFVEWVGANSTELEHIYSDETIGYLINTPYYDEENAGLFGFKIIKDEEGEIIERFAAFSSIKNGYAITVLGRVPNSVDFETGTWVGYVKGTFILNYSNGHYVSFTLGGGVHSLTGFSDNFNALGDEGCIAIEGFGGAATFVMNEKFETQTELEGRFCIKDGGYASSNTKYMFGTNINKKYYFLKDEESSYKFWQGKEDGEEVWRAEVVDKRIWAYQKKLMFDYATNNWTIHPLKTLKYNLIKNNISVVNHLPKDSEVEFPGSDMHGDFVREKVSRKVFHTFDFKHWSEVSGDGASHLYGCQGRIWIKDSANGISGIMPYGIEVKDVDDLMGGRKTILQFSGFIFRGGLN